MSLFSTPSKIDINLENDTDIRGSFLIKDTTYKIWGRHNHLMSGTSLGENVWEMFFAMCEDDDVAKGRHNIQVNESTKKGHSIKVYSTIIEFMKYIYKKQQPTDVVFSVKNEKVKRLNLKLIERYQKLGLIKGVSASEKGNIIKFELEKNEII